MVNSGNGKRREIWDGFSWPAFLIPELWYLFHGMWAMSGGLVLVLLLGSATIPGVIGIVALCIRVYCGKSANQDYRAYLAKHGYQLAKLLAKPEP